MRNLVRGLEHIHQKGIIHRNLDCSNILVTYHNSPIITGLSLAVNKDSGDYDLVGSWNYMAPELLKIPHEYSEASDVFSLGCIFYRIYTLKNAYEDIEKRDKVLKFKRRTEERVYKLEEIIKRMLLTDPDKRITLKEVEEEIDIISPIPDNSIGLFCSAQEFYLEKRKVYHLTLDEMISFSKMQFSGFWSKDLIPVYIYIYICIIN